VAPADTLSAMADYETRREPQADGAAAFGWRYTRNETVSPAAAVTPLAAPTTSVLVSQLLP